MAKTIPYDPKARTKYSTAEYMKQFESGDSNDFMIWLFWDTSTEFMAGNGLPTDADIAEWIKVLEARKDAKSDVVKRMISSCVDYITPFVPPVVKTTALKVNKGQVLTQKK